MGIYSHLVHLDNHTNLHWYNLVTNRGEFVMKKSWPYNIAFTVTGELFAAVLQICGGPQTSIGNAPHLCGPSPDPPC